MKRKVIQLAGKTAVVSLPSAWVKKYGVKKGDEVDITLKEGSLVVRVEAKGKGERITVNTAGLHERVVRHLLSALHKKGYDEMEILYENPQTIQIVQDLLKNLFIGFTILEQTSKRCVLKSIAHDMPEEFDATLRRAFLVTLSLADGTLDCMKRGKYHDMKELVALENMNNQLTNFCERVMNKYGMDERTPFMYVIAWNLEKIADEYKYLCNAMYPYEKNMSTSITDVHVDVNMIVKSFYDFFYNSDMQKLNDIHSLVERTEEKLQKIIPQNQEEKKVLSIFSAIMVKAVDFSSSMIALKYQKSES